MQVKQIMSQPVATCRSNDPLHIAAQRMWDSDCGVVPVVNDEGCAVAMITDRDICMAAYTQGKPLAEIEVRSAMSHEFFSCGPNDSLQEVEEMMRSHSIRRVPVLDEVGRPVGIVSMNDLVMSEDGHQGYTSAPAQNGGGSWVLVVERLCPESVGLARLGRRRDFV